MGCSPLVPRPIRGRGFSERNARDHSGRHLVVVANVIGEPVPPWGIDRAVRAARGKVKDLPEGFRFHDLRHYFASLLIGSGADVKVVQTRLRHASAMTTLNTYGHMWPDADESARTAVDEVLTARRNAAKKKR